jgi:hypothetical protein
MMALLDVASYEAFLWTRRGCCHFSWGWKSTAYADMSSTAPMTIMHPSMHVFDFFVAGKLSVSASETAGASSCLLPFTRYVRMHVQLVICFIACKSGNGLGQNRIFWSGLSFGLAWFGGGMG